MQRTKKFVGRSFHGKNQCDVVAMVPTEMDYAAFKYPAHNVDVARLQLLFTFTITPDPECDGIEPEEVEAAFVQRFQPFADSRGFPLYSHDGHGRNRQGKSM
jgi:hypothetical protein